MFPEILPGLVFGLVDNGVLIFGAITGLEIERFFSKGSGALGVFVGCLVPLLFIPFLKRFIR